MSEQKGYFRVVNIKGDPDFRPTKDEAVIMMDRTNPLLGNKHPMKVKTWQERDRVIELFRQHLDADFAKNGPMRQALLEIARDIVEQDKKVAGACWCAGAACHVDVIAKRVYTLIQEIRQNQEVEQATGLCKVKSKL